MDPKKVIQRVLKSRAILKYIQDKNLHSDKIPVQTIQSIIASAKRMCRNAKEFEIGVKNRKNIKGYDTASQHANELIAIYELAARVYKEYECELSSQNKLDFDDLLLKTMQIFKDNKRNKCLDLICKTNKFAHIVIDEFQDTNSIQFEIAKTLILHRFSIFGDHKSLMVVGDIDQTSLVCTVCIELFNRIGHIFQCI